MTLAEYQRISAAMINRPHFGQQYTFKKADRKKVTDKDRLLDLLLCVAAYEDQDYLTVPGPGEFAVVDMLRQEKGFFMLPNGFTDDQVSTLIHNLFGSKVLQINRGEWVV